MSIGFMIMTLSSVALPGSNGFVGEFPILIGSFQTHPIFVLFAGAGVILGAVYALKAYQLVMLGPQTRNDLDHLKDLNTKEVMAILLLTFFVFGIGFFPKAFFHKSDTTLNIYSDTLIQKVGSHDSH
jgi:NADH-quinone oxidoreductase subunit M